MAVPLRIAIADLAKVPVPKRLSEFRHWGNATLSSLALMQGSANDND